MLFVTLSLIAFNAESNSCEPAFHSALDFGAARRGQGKSRHICCRRMPWMISCSINPETEKRQLSFLKWAEDRGIQHKLVKISLFDGLRGLAATDELFPGQVSIPRSRPIRPK